MIFFISNKNNNINFLYIEPLSTIDIYLFYWLKIKKKKIDQKYGLMTPEEEMKTFLGAKFCYLFIDFFPKLLTIF